MQMLELFKSLVGSLEAVFDRFRKRSEKTRRQVEKVVRTTAQQALVRGARTLRRQADDLQAGLKKLSSKLARLEQGRKPA